jgi:ribulose kinase
MTDHYIGIDVGTGSARACLIDGTGDIKALASEDIKLWQYAGKNQETYYVGGPSHRVLLYMRSHP